MTGNAADLRLELAAQRVRIAALEEKVERLVEIMSSSAAARAARAEARREREIMGRYALIRAVAGFLKPGNTEALARQIERVYARESPTPCGAAEYLERLRRWYGHGGPSRRTIRRALTDSPSECVNAGAAENCGISTQHRKDATWESPATSSSRTSKR